MKLEAFSELQSVWKDSASCNELYIYVLPFPYMRANQLPQDDVKFRKKERKKYAYIQRNQICTCRISYNFIILIVNYVKKQCSSFILVPKPCLKVEQHIWFNFSWIFRCYLHFCRQFFFLQVTYLLCVTIAIIFVWCLGVRIYKYVCIHNFVLWILYWQ